MYWDWGLGVETGDEALAWLVANVEAVGQTGTTDVMTEVVFWLAGQFVTEDGQAVMV